MNAQKFLRLHQAQVRSGLSIAAFCRKRGLALSSYHYWRRRYANAPAGNGFVELQLTGNSLPPQNLPSGSTSPVVGEQPIELLYRGASLSLPLGFSPSSLRQCLEVLRESLPC